MDTYIPLLSDPALVNDVHNDGWDSSVPRRSSYAPQRKAEVPDRRVWIVLFATLISLVSLVLNIADFRSPPPQPSTKLIYPNPYVGLDRAVLTDAAPAPPIVNFPHLLAPINSSDPSAVYLHQVHWQSSFGMIYPEEREFLVDTQVSTVAQFRTIDFKMERCVATLEIPSPADVQNLTSKRVSLSSQPFLLEIWTLDTTEDIPTRTLSYTTRPPRTSLLTTMVVDSGYTLRSSPPFPCPSRSLLTFEIGCSIPGCSLHFRQDTKSPRLAFYITQYPSAY
ncbi:hypothetical protein B0H11DRAFT_2263585 [Mycena galericulata]|nr:hypothetical protein B0H11DRAFT_2263585 [Mycena galericulata]